MSSDWHHLQEGSGELAALSSNVHKVKDRKGKLLLVGYYSYLTAF
jgi:hypothetical protein